MTQRSTGRRRATTTAVVVCSFAVAAAALALIWQPWKTTRPGVPSALQGQGTSATSIRLLWVAPRRGRKVEQYLIVRDAMIIGAVSAPSTSYVDKGLPPGTTHSYQVVASAGNERSSPSTAVTASSLDPSPDALVAVSVRATSANLKWSAPPASPRPDGYVVTRDDRRVAMIAGSRTSYVSIGLLPATNYRYQVAAVWAAVTSPPSPPLSVTTRASNAPLQGPYTVQYKMLTTPGPGASGTVGQTWDDGWAFLPDCAAAACPVSASGGFSPPLFANVRLSFHLTRDADAYSGSTAGVITRCGPAPGVAATNTVTLTVTGGDGDVWTTWTGSMAISSPYVRDGSFYCPAQSWTMKLEATTGGAGALPPTSSIPSLMALSNGSKPPPV